MPARKLSLPSSKRHVNVFDEDWEFLCQHFGGGSDNKLGVGHAIRTIIHAKVNELKAKANAAVDRLKTEEMEQTNEQSEAN